MKIPSLTANGSVGALVLTLLLSASAVVATGALAQGNEPVMDAKARMELRAIRARATLHAGDEQREELQTQYRGLLVAFRDARAEVEAAAIQRSKARQDQRRRGEARVASDKRIEDAATRAQETNEDLADFYTSARSGGIERSWLDRVEDAFPDLISELPDRG